MTLEEWADLDEDVAGELVDGRLEEEEVPTFLHEEVLRWLVVALTYWLTPIGGRIYGSEAKLAINSKRGRKSDASVYLPGRMLPGRAKGATMRPPSIVIEVLSPRLRDQRRDRVEKRKDYRLFGVPYYWLVDPQARTFEVYELGPDGRYTVALEAAEGAHAIPGCEGLVLDLDAMWSAADSLPEDEAES